MNNPGCSPRSRATPPTNSSKIPSLAKSSAQLHNASTHHASDHAITSAATPPGIILVPANPKLLHSARSAGARSASRRGDKPRHSTARRGQTRSPSPYQPSAMHSTPDESAAMRHNLARKASRRVPLHDRMNTSRHYLAATQQHSRDSAGHESYDSATGAENRNPSYSHYRPPHQPQRKRSCGAHTRDGAGKSTTVTTVPASAAADSNTVRGPGRRSSSAVLSGRSAHPAAHRVEATSAAARAVQWEHPHGAVVTEGALLQESSVSDQPPMSVAHWKVERSAGELAKSQHAAFNMYASSTSEHCADQKAGDPSQHAADTGHEHHSRFPDLGTFCQEGTDRRNGCSELLASKFYPAHHVGCGVGDTYMHEQNGQKVRLRKDMILPCMC